jgi:hypothetical protein
MSKNRSFLILIVLLILSALLLMLSCTNYLETVRNLKINPWDGNQHCYFIPPPAIVLDTQTPGMYFLDFMYTEKPGNNSITLCNYKRDVGRLLAIIANPAGPPFSTSLVFVSSMVFIVLGFVTTKESRLGFKADFSKRAIITRYLASWAGFISLYVLASIGILIIVPHSVGIRIPISYFQILYFIVFTTLYFLFFLLGAICFSIKEKAYGRYLVYFSCGLVLVTAVYYLYTMNPQKFFIIEAEKDSKRQMGKLLYYLPSRGERYKSVASIIFPQFWAQDFMNAYAGKSDDNVDSFLFFAAERILRDTPTFKTIGYTHTDETGRPDRIPTHKENIFFQDSYVPESFILGLLFMTGYIVNLVSRVMRIAENEKRIDDVNDVVITAPGKGKKNGR